MPARSAQHQAAEAFTTPEQVNQRRYEALRVFFVDGLSYAEAGERFGYTRWATINQARDYRNGKLTLSAAPRKPGPAPGSAPAKERVRGRVIELRREGLSTYEISARLASENTPLNRTSVGEILTEEGFGRLLRHPEPAASTNPATAGRDTRRPRTSRIDFGSWPATTETGKAGLLLPIPDLVAPGLPEPVRKTQHPDTRAVPAMSWLLSLPALKPTRTRRVSHVDDLPICDPAASLFAGLSVLPKKPALTSYSYRTGHDHQRRFLAALDTQMIHTGLATADNAIFDLDFHAAMHRGHDPALEKHYVPTRSQRARSMLTFFAQDTGTHNPVYANADVSKASRNREMPAFCDHRKTVSGNDPAILITNQKVATHTVLGELTARGVEFLTLRMRSPALMRHVDALGAKDFKTVALDRSGKSDRPKVNEPPGVQLTNYPGTVRQLVVTGLGRDTPTVIITNDYNLTAKALIAHHARRMTIEQRLAEIIGAFHTDALSSAVNLNVDLDITLCVLAQALTAALHARLPGYANVTPDVLQHRFLETPGQIITNHDTITVRLDPRAYSPVPRQADLPNNTLVPWRENRTLRFEFN